MKKNFTISTLLIAACTTALHAQPVLQNSALLPVGFFDSLSVAPATIAPGPGGANLTWDLHTLATQVVGYFTIVDPSAAPYIATFPTANFCVNIVVPLGSATDVYTYDRVSDTAWEELAENYHGVGTGKDFSPNPQATLKLPFHYLDSTSDIYLTTVALTDTDNILYDAYGTLITPFNTYTNVARVKRDFGAGNYMYTYYSLSPFTTIMNYDASSNLYSFYGKHLPATAVANVVTTQTTIQVYPNPVTGHAVIKVVAGKLDNALFTLTDITGRIVRKLPINQTETEFQKEGLGAGVYFYQVINNGEQAACGKFVIQ